MKSDFERKRFIQRFVILAVILLAVVGIGIRFLFGGDEKRIAVILLMLAVGLVILFFISYREIDHTYREIEHVSDEMLRVLQEKMSCRRKNTCRARSESYIRTFIRW